MVYTRRHFQLSSASGHGSLDPSLLSRHLSSPAPAMPGTAARASMREVRLDILPGVVRRAFKIIWPTDGRLALGTVNPVRRLGEHEVCSPAHPRTCQGIRLRDEIKQHLASTLPLPPWTQCCQLSSPLAIAGIRQSAAHVRCGATLKLGGSGAESSSIAQCCLIVSINRR